MMCTMFFLLRHSLRVMQNKALTTTFNCQTTRQLFALDGAG